MAVNKVAFRLGKLEALKNAPNVEGTFSVTTDEHALYLDVAEGQRIRLGDFIKVKKLTDLEAITEPAETALYYVEEINCLACHDADQGWVQINRDTGATEVEVTGGGNGITSATYDKDTRTIKITIDKTFLTGEEVDAKISEVVGEVPGEKSVVEYIDEKTKDIANEGEISEITGRLDALEGAEGKVKWNKAAEDVGTVMGDYLKAEDRTALEGKIDAKQDKLVFEGAYNAESNKAATMSDVAAAVSGLSGAMHWIGTVETEPNAESGAGRQKGDVVSYKGVEYAWDGAAWQKLGDESMYSEKVAGWDEAAKQKHTHENAAELDKIKTGDKEKWDAAAGKADTNAAAITAIKDDDTIDSFGDVKTELNKKADSAAVTALVGDTAGISATTIKEAAKEAEEYADEQIEAKLTEVLTWGSF